MAVTASVAVELITHTSTPSTTNATGSLPSSTASSRRTSAIASRLRERPHDARSGTVATAIFGEEIRSARSARAVDASASTAQTQRINAAVSAGRACSASGPKVSTSSSATRNAHVTGSVRRTGASPLTERAARRQPRTQSVEVPATVKLLTRTSAAPPGMGHSTEASSTATDHASVGPPAAGSRPTASSSAGVHASLAAVADAACPPKSTRRPLTSEAPQLIDSAERIPSLNATRPATRTSSTRRPAMTASIEGAGPVGRSAVIRRATAAMRGTQFASPARRRKSRGAAAALIPASKASTLTNSVPSAPRAAPVQRWPPSLSTSSRSARRSTSHRADLKPTSTSTQHSDVHLASASAGGAGWKLTPKAAAAFRAALWTSSAASLSRARKTSRAASRNARIASVGATASRSASRLTSAPLRRGNVARRRGGARSRAYRGT